MAVAVGLNGRVLYGLAVAVAIVVVVVGVRAIQRRRRDEIRSVHHYHDRLDTLHVEAHDRGGSVRVVDEEPVPVERVEPHRPRLDPDAANLETWAPAPSVEERPLRHDRSWALGRMQPRARVDLGTVLIVAIVVVVLCGIAFAGYLIQRGRTSSPSTTTTTGSHALRTAPTHAERAQAEPIGAPSSTWWLASSELQVGASRTSSTFAAAVLS